MLKTIKTTKYLNLHELIKYVWENPEIFFKDYIKETFFTNNYGSVTFYKVGGFMTNTCIDPDELFKVEVEEEITEDTEFELLVGIYFYDDVGRYNASTFYNRSIDDVKDSEALCIYALINEKLELVWERDDHGSNWGRRTVARHRY